MFEDMKQFLSSDVCLSCEGCCRFDKEKSDWRAKVGMSEEQAILANFPLSQKIQPKEAVEKGGYLKDKLCHGIYACTFFNPEDTTCGIYHHRPFECRLYPFVLTQWKKKTAVCVHLLCPYIGMKKDSPEYDQYVGYLKELFQKQNVKLFLKENPHLFGDYLGYENELELVFDVDL